MTAKPVQDAFSASQSQLEPSEDAGPGSALHGARLKQLRPTQVGDLVGQSEVMRELFADIRRVAPFNVSVLIEGETGTGKELVAEALHRFGSRSSGPFVVFDCSAVAPNLVESEIFGHVAGAFTGASSTRMGLFQQAHRGTIFLDELGELPKELQPKLLRVLERGEVRRLGATRSERVDLRENAATNRNLIDEIERGNFREDLFFRVAGAHLHVPPLRDREGDLELLMEHFLAQQSPSRGLEDVPPHAWELFRSHHWPGNVRELKNAVQRLLVTPDRPLPHADACSPVSRRSTLRPEQSGKHPLPLREARRAASERFEQSYLRMALETANNNVTRAAAIAGVSRQMIQKLMRRHGL